MQNNPQHTCEYKLRRYPDILDEEGMSLLCVECITCRTALPKWNDILDDALVIRTLAGWNPLSLARHIHFWLVDVGEPNAHGLQHASKWENYYTDNRSTVQTNLQFVHQILSDFRNTMPASPLPLMLTESDLGVIVQYLHAKLPPHLGHPNSLIYIINSLTLLTDFLPLKFSSDDMDEPFWRELKFNRCHVMHLSGYVYQRILDVVRPETAPRSLITDFRLKYLPFMGVIQEEIGKNVASIHMASDLIRCIVEYVRVYISLEELKRWVKKKTETEKGSRIKKRLMD
jgi:hypothetical protein